MAGRGTKDIILTRGAVKDVVVCVYPSIPDRARLNAAYRRALGYRDETAETPDEGAFNPEDLAAVCWAALGLSWTGKLEDLATFRECGRDVVAYGEGVATALYLAGFSDPDEQVQAGREVYSAAMQHMMAAQSKAEEDFPKAPGQT